MKQILLLLTVFVLGAKPAFADDSTATLSLTAIPRCSLDKPSDRLICSYSLDEWKQVMKIEKDLLFLREQLKNHERRSVALARQIRLLTGQRDTYAESQKILVTRVEVITDRLIEMNRKYEIERTKPVFGSPVGWTIAAVSTSILAGFVIKEFVD